LDVPFKALAKSEKQSLNQAKITAQRFLTGAFGGPGHLFAGYPRRRHTQIAEQ